ncbi:MAG: gamma-glutamylcyclotransferase family protein [Woeseiaceae bacterium]
MHYLAYGSNLHPIRLIDRVPGARLAGTTALIGYRLTFHKRSVDGSAKCNLDDTDDSTDIAYAAVYSLPEDEVHLLDKAEGLGNGYFKRELRVELRGLSLKPFSYFASDTHLSPDLQPYHWYKGLVLAGACKHQFPEHYVKKIAAIAAKYDLNIDRRKKMEYLLARLKD